MTLLFSSVLNPCASNPCQQGVCSPLPGDCSQYTCSCDPCFQGPNCQTRKYTTVKRQYFCYGMEIKELNFSSNPLDLYFVNLIYVSTHGQSEPKCLDCLEWQKNVVSFVTHYSKRYLTALPTSYWFGINTFSHKCAAICSSQEVHQ